LTSGRLTTRSYLQGPQAHPRSPCLGPAPNGSHTFRRPVYVDDPLNILSRGALSGSPWSDRWSKLQPSVDFVSAERFLARLRRRATTLARAGTMEGGFHRSTPPQPSQRRIAAGWAASRFVSESSRRQNRRWPFCPQVARVRRVMAQPRERNFAATLEAER